MRPSPLFLQCLCPWCLLSRFRSRTTMHLARLEPNWCSRDWSFADIGWYSTIAPNGITGPLKGIPNRLSCGVFPSESLSWIYRRLQQRSIESTHHSLPRPDCNSTADVLSFTLRTVLSAIPCVSDLCGVDVQWFQDSCSQERPNSKELSVYMTFGFLEGSRNFIRFLRVSREVFVLHGYDCNYWVAKSWSATANRSLFRDSLFSLRSLWFAVIKSPKFSALGTTVPARLLQDALVILVFKQNFTILVLREVRNLVPRVPRGSVGGSWDELEVCAFLCIRSPRRSSEVPSSIKFSLNSCSPSSKWCDISLCTSRDPSFWFWFSVSVESCSRSPRSSSLDPLLSCTGFSACLLNIKYWILWWRWWR